MLLPSLTSSDPVRGVSCVLVSWNFKHIVNLGRIRLFNAVNLEQGYGLIEIRTPREVLADEEGF